MMEVKRKVSKVIVTEDGLFHDGQVPGSYDGPQLSIEIVHATVFADEAGHLITFTCYAPPAMDSNHNYTLYDPSQMTVIEAPVSETFGDSSGYHHRLPQAVKDKVGELTTWIESDGESKVMP